MALVSDGNLPYLKTNISKNITIQNKNTFTLGKSLGKSKPVTGEMLLLFIRIIGCLDIIFLSAYLAVCIYDRKGQETTTDFVPLSLNSPQHSTVYENIEDDLFSASVMH